MNNPTPTAALTTLGCRVNQYESDAIAERLQRDGFTIVPFGTPADVIIVNTCTVTGESDSKSRKLIRRAAATGAPVIVTGCFSQVWTEDVPLPPGICHICGNGDKEQIPAIARRLIEETNPTPQIAVSHIHEAKYDGFTLTTPHRTRSYIKIEDGCENRCAYCIIPKARGRVRSKEKDVILVEIRNIAATGSKEVILTGIETASWGRDLYPAAPYGTHLAALLREVDAVNGIERIGLGSLEPTVMSEAFTETAASLRHLLPHLHLSIQSGSTGVLNRMRRRYTADMALRCIERMRAAVPDITFSADIIAGFPGETDAEFEETAEFCRKVGFLHLHIFPYSVRRGTEAASMPDQVPVELRRDRLRKLEEIQKEIKKNLLDNYISTHTENTSPVWVLTEKNRNGILSGHSEHFAEVFAPIPAGTRVAVGEIVPIVLTETDGDICRGHIAR